jgi:hypothetical protein
MEDMDEIKELLREIRDLQKAHFERYKEFTEAVLVRQQAGAEQLEHSRVEQRRYRQEMRQAVEDSRSRVRTALVTRWVIVGVATAVLVVGVSGAVMAMIFALAMKK